MDVLTAMWASQVDTGTEPARQHGCCARCTTQGPGSPVTSAVSKTFTGYDDWANPRGRFLCEKCAWAYKTPALRSNPHQVTRAPVTTVLTRQQVARTLGAGAVGNDEALVIPLRPGRKHLVPGARWGRVTVDNATLPWGTADAELLGVVVRLRARGFGSRMLTEPAPPFTVLARQPHDQWVDVLADWDRLTPWRDTDSPWLPLALHATTPST